MRRKVRFTIAAIIASALAVTAVGLPLVARSGAPEGSPKLVVHEWGTFTNFAGADGGNLEFRPLLDSDLPPFVLDRAQQNQDLMSFSKRVIVARQRMETPVTYFYTDRPMDVSARVSFPHGLLTEFYPPVQALGPAYPWGGPEKLENSFLDWGKLRLLPEPYFAKIRFKEKNGALTPAAMPKVEGDNHYAFARETDSAVVERADGFGGYHYEKFLFYRGLGNFKLPLSLAAQGGGRFVVTNYGPDPVQSLFLVHIEGDEVRFTHVPRIEANGVLYLEQSSAASTDSALGDAMAAALVDTGLYEKEARSMVKTWRSSWFGEQGTRLLYFVPERLTNEILPLKVSPPPSETVRVLVGRMEIMTPEHESRLAARIRDLGTCLSLTSEPLAGELALLGRFAEPALERLLQNRGESDIRNQIQAVLTELRAQ